MIPGKKIQDELTKLKKLVRNSKNYFNPNYKRFNDFRKFTFETTISKEEREVNNELNRPNIEANVGTAYISRLCGEFSKQEPSIEVSMDEGSNVDPQIVPVIEGHFRHIMEEAKKANTQYSTYRDGLSGGFCALEAMTDYANEKSFDQVIKFRKSKYPTMAGFDPLATDPHKGDGDYCFQLYPKTKKDFLEEYDVDIGKIKFPSAHSIEGFTWSFNNTEDDVLLICRMFRKKKKKIKINDVAGQKKAMTDDEYKKFSEEWMASGKMEQVPVIVRSRQSFDVTICCYIFIETMVLDYEETDFKYLPIVFVDGDSVDLYDDSRGSLMQFTRPYLYNTAGAQRLKNLGVQSLAGYLNTMSQHKYIVKKEAIPEERSYLDALTRVQQASTIVVNAFKDNNPAQPIPDPIMPVQPQAAPPEISSTISMADQIIQNELGSYDAALGINENQLSGVAIVEAATQSNAAAMPFVVNYIQALNQIALIVIDLMPKYYKTPMTLPIITQDGKRDSVPINQPGGLDFNYDSNIFQVKVTAGVNFNIQKSRALNQIIAMCQAAPGFAQFMQTKGLQVLIDNFDIRGSDILKKLAEEYEQEQQQMQQQQMQMAQQAQQNNPQMLNAHAKVFTATTQAQLQAKELQLKQQQLQTEIIADQADRDAALARAHAEEVRAQADEVRSNAELAMQHAEMKHQHAKDDIEMGHKIHQSNFQNDQLVQQSQQAQTQGENQNGQ